MYRCSSQKQAVIILVIARLHEANKAAHVYAAFQNLCASERRLGGDWTLGVRGSHKQPKNDPRTTALAGNTGSTGQGTIRQADMRCLSWRPSHISPITSRTVIAWCVRAKALATLSLTFSSTPTSTRRVESMASQILEKMASMISLPLTDAGNGAPRHG